jgi:uncharacterized membrane protein YagU involved in acid resistance
MHSMSDSKGGFILRGIIAGAIGAWVMDRVTWIPLDRQPMDTIEREKAARPDGLEVSHLLGYRLAKAAGFPVEKKQPSTLGMFTHYMLGIGPAIVYAGLRERNLSLSADRGLLYGFTIFALWDEMASVATGIARPPQTYPWQAHMRGLIGHLALGFTTHVALTALETDFDLRPLREAHRGA